jgi:hypothetical protein
MRALRDLEPPAGDEGFAAVETMPFERSSRGAESREGVFVAAAVLDAPEWRDAIQSADPSAPHLIFDWRWDGSNDALDEPVALVSSVVTGEVEGALCPHGGGAPRCWCRPPLPGLPLTFARAHGVDPMRSTLVGTSTAHRTLATTLGARFVEV